MNVNEYLNAAKQAMDLTSDYQLAKRMGTSKQTISAYRTGTQWPDNYIVIRLAIALNLDPTMVLADLESQREKRPERAAFWRSFLSRAVLMVVLACTLAWSSTAISPPAAGRISGTGDNRYDDEVRIIWRYVSP